MSDSPPSPTPYADVNALLHSLLACVQAILAEQFVGLYLYGSLASGDFDRQTSDVDFVVVTAVALTNPLIAQLDTMHSHLRDSGLKWATKLEGSYIPQAALRRYRPNDAPRPTLNEGRFYLAPHGADWVIQRAILRQHGVVVAGPPLQPMIDPVPPEALRGAVRQILAEWWKPMLPNPAWLQSADYQVYAVLSMCRVLHALQFGTIVSKPVAARWAQATLGEPWAALIEQALLWRPSAPFEQLPQVLALMAYAIEQGGV